MKLVNKAYGTDYYTSDVGIGFRGTRNHKKPADLKLKRGLKRQLSKARRVAHKEVIRREGGAV